MTFHAAKTSSIIVTLDLEYRQDRSMTYFQSHKSSCNEVYKFEFGTFYFFDEFVISEINEGVTLVFDDTLELIELIKDYYAERPFGYLSNRINSYSIDPTGYYKVEESFPNLAGFAVVIYNQYKGALEIEKLFLNAPFKGFQTIEKASFWLSGLVKDKRLESA